MSCKAEGKMHNPPNDEMADFSCGSPGMLTPTYWTHGKPAGITTVHPIKAEKACITDTRECCNSPPEIEESPSNSRFGQYLEVPKPNRMFLISPPSSPPVGWEPIEEDGPVINYELLAAIATLASEEEAIVELCPGSDTTPQLIVKCI